MDDVQKAKLQANIAASWKMYSVRFVTLFSAAASAAIAWFLGLPTDCAPLLAMTPPQPCTISQLSILSKAGIGAATLPIIAGALAWWLRVHPQTNLTPAEAEGKSATPGPAEAQEEAQVKKFTDRPMGD